MQNSSLRPITQQQFQEIERLKQFVSQSERPSLEAPEQSELCIRSELQEHNCPICFEPIPLKYVTHVRSNNADYIYDVQCLLKALEQDRMCRDPLTRTPYTLEEFRRIQAHAKRAGLCVPSDAVLQAVREVRDMFSNVKARASYSGMLHIHDDIHADMERIIRLLREERRPGGMPETDLIQAAYGEAAATELKWKRMVEEQIYLASLPPGIAAAARL